MAQKRIGEHIIDIPDWKEGMELLNEGLSSADSYWRRIEFPQLYYDVNELTIFNADGKSTYNDEKVLIRVSTEDTIILRKLVERELVRRTKGVHIKIKDEIIWIAPDYYFFLQLFQQKDIDANEDNERFGSFRKIQNDILQLWEYVKHNPNIAGLVMPKIKKMGMTYLFAGAFLNEALTTKNNDFLMMSKDHDTCKNSLFAFIEYGYDNLPYITKPYTSSRDKTTLKFGEPTDKKRKNTYNAYLKCVLKAVKTKSAAFDGHVPYRGWIDEFPKIWKASKISVKEVFDKSIESVKKNQQITGKLLLTSYMPEESDKGFIEGRKICENSLLSTIKEGSLRTESNLIIFPIYAYQSNQEAFDIYGDCNEKLATQIVIQDRSDKKTAKDLQTHKRQYPMSWIEMFDSTGAGSVFDGIRLSSRLNGIRAEESSGVLGYKQGHLRWENSLWETERRPMGEFCNVYFEELTPKQILEGEIASFRIFHDLNDTLALKPILNRVVRENIKRNGLYVPHNQNLGVLSVDPVDYKLDSMVRQGSMNASYGGFIFDQNIDSISQKHLSNTPIYEYNFRHEHPDKIMEDMIKAVMYFGFYAVIEGNKGWLYTEFINHGLQNFLLVKQADGSLTPWIDFAEFHGGNKMVHTTENTISSYCRAIQRYIGVIGISDYDYLSSITSERLIKHLIDFEPNDTKKYDMAVAFGYWRMAVENYTTWLMNKNRQNNLSPLGKDANLDMLRRICM